MSYRIAYKYNRKYKRQHDSKPWMKLIAVIVLVSIGIYSLHFIPWKKLLPGDPKVTGEALDRLVSSITVGEPIAEAFSSFCEEIVSHANLPQ